jgi:membrane fusion protein, multidrug efflux system
MQSEASVPGNGQSHRTEFEHAAAVPKKTEHLSVEQPGGEEPAPKASRGRKGRLKIILACALGASLAAGGYYFQTLAGYESTDDAYIDGHVISISPQVSGVVAALHVGDNQYVHKGDPLVELDPTDYQVALNQARGAEASARGKLEQARAGVETAESAVAQAQAEVDVALATLENAERTVNRYHGLDEHARSQQDVDTAQVNRKMDAATVEQAKAKLRSAQTQVVSAKANVISAEGDYRKAQADTRRGEVNLGYCRIVAAVDGRISKKAVEPGAYVTPENPLFAIVPSEVWVVANFKETQLSNMRPGQPVTLKVDAYPNLALSGKVDSIQSGTGSRFSVIPAENATGNFVKVVQRVPVKITLDAGANGASARLLAPGMSVEPKVRVHG